MHRSLQTVAALLCVVATLAGTDSLRPPLPVFTRVSTDTTANVGSTHISVEYLAPERPNVTWFVDDFPIPKNRLDFQMFNYYEAWGIANLFVSRDEGRQFSICLQNVVAEACLQLRPLQKGNLVEELEFPWPFLIPAPRARYGPAEKVKVFAPVLNTPHNYTYSALLLSHNPTQSDGQLVETTSRDMQGGLEGDVVTIAPVTSGSEGWMVEVATDTANYEGVLFVTTTFRPESQLVQTCITTRPLTVYRRDHTAPFNPGFVAKVSRDQPEWSMSWRCRQGFDCLIICPFLSNGNVTATFARMSGSGMQEVAGKASMWKLGEYYGSARFIIREFNARRDSGTYICQMNTTSKTVINSVFVS